MRNVPFARAVGHRNAAFCHQLQIRCETFHILSPPHDLRGQKDSRIAVAGSQTVGAVRNISWPACAAIGSCLRDNEGMLSGAGVMPEINNSRSAADEGSLVHSCVNMGKNGVVVCPTVGNLKYI